MLGFQVRELRPYTHLDQADPRGIAWAYAHFRRNTFGKASERRSVS